MQNCRYEKKTTWQDGWQKLAQRAFTRAGRPNDYIAAHNYYSGWSDAGGFMKSVKVIEDDIKNITGSDRIKRRSASPYAQNR